MKRFSNYQYVEGEPMSERDKKEAGSKFWNKGKWDNFVVPFLPDDCKNMILVDMGCNAGLFLKLAQDRGFSRVIGVDVNKEAIRRARNYKERNGGTYEILYSDIRACIDKLPAADFIVFANSHYYLPIDHWLNLLDKLRVKTRYCILVTVEKRIGTHRASGHLVDIRNYFRDWRENGITKVSLENDPFPRPLYGLCFKSCWIDRVSIDNLIDSNSVWRTLYDFWVEIDKGVDFCKTPYYEILKKRRIERRKWDKDKVDASFRQKIEIFQDMKKNGLKEPLIVDRNNKVIDGNHRLEIMRYLGYKSVLVRRV